MTTTQLIIEPLETTHIPKENSETFYEETLYTIQTVELDKQLNAQRELMTTKSKIINTDNINYTHDLWNMIATLSTYGRVYQDIHARKHMARTALAKLIKKSDEK